MDELLTTNADVKILKASINKEPPGLMKELTPAADLTARMEKTRSNTTFNQLVTPDTLSNYQFRRYVEERRQGKSFLTFLESMVAFKHSSETKRKAMAVEILASLKTLAISADGADAGIEQRSLLGNRETTITSDGVSANGGSDVSASGVDAELPGQVDIVTENGNSLESWLMRNYPKAYDPVERAVSMGGCSADMWDTVASVVARYLENTHKMSYFESPEFTTYVQLLEYLDREPTLGDYRTFRTLGKGAFGSVMAVQRKDTAQMYACKCMHKKIVKKNKGLKWVLAEKLVLQMTRSPFVLDLHYAFTSQDEFHLIFKMLSGGDLDYQLNEEKSGCFNPDRARFYAAEVLLGLEHLHSLNVVYRDLKPANILLDKEGHCVISDLGLAIEIDPKRPEKTRRYAGTPGYMAPEILAGKGTYFTSDWWTFGVFLYESVLGVLPESCKCSDEKKEWCPFRRSKHKKHFNLKDWTCKINIEYPSDCGAFDEDLIDFLSQIFVVDPLARLGANGAEELKKHSYFKNTDWEQMSAREVPVPFIPNFDVNAASMGSIKPFDAAKYQDVVVDEKDEKVYKEFTYVNKDLLASELMVALDMIKAAGLEALEARSSMKASFFSRARTSIMRPRSSGVSSELGDENVEAKACCAVM